MRFLFLLLLITPVLISHGQSQDIDSLINQAESLSGLQNKSILQWEAEKKLRTQIIELSEDLSNNPSANKVPDKKHDELSARLDSMIDNAYRIHLKNEKAPHSAKYKIALYDLIQTKESWLNIEGPGETGQLYTAEALDSMVKSQKKRITSIDKNLAALKTPSSDSNKEMELAKTTVFNQQSIISQVIKANLEAKKSFALSMAIDNKGFEDRKAFMQVPLQNGTLNQRYGAGIDGIGFISANATVTSVCQGEVVYAKKLGGEYYTVIILHDKNYYTVYTGLETTYVAYGDTVNYAQAIGKARTYKQNQHKLIFEIWKEGSTINPIHWIKNG